MQQMKPITLCLMALVFAHPVNSLESKMRGMARHSLGSGAEQDMKSEKVQAFRLNAADATDLEALATHRKANVYEYVGCYEGIQYSSARPTPYGVVPLTIDGVQQCRDVCASGGYLYFGFECPHGDGTKVYCQCGNTKTDGGMMGKKVGIQKCSEFNTAGDAKCSGPFTVTGSIGTYVLGAGSIGSFYARQAAIITTTTTATSMLATTTTTTNAECSGWKLIGCKARRPNTLFPSVKEANMTTNVCLQFCSTGYSESTSFGLEGGDTCYCFPYEFETSKTAPELSGCDIPCAGNSGEMCGGKDVSLIYKMDDCQSPFVRCMNGSGIPEVTGAEIYHSDAYEKHMSCANLQTEFGDNINNKNCDVHCIPGFKLTRNDIQCELQETESDQEPYAVWRGDAECEPYDCGEPDCVAHATNEEGPVSYPNSVKYACSLGYTTDGTPTGNASFFRSCLATGELEEPEACMPIVCGEAPVDPNGVLTSPYTVYNVEREATYRCNEGYTVDGDAAGKTWYAKQCLGGGKFSSLWFCLPVSCGPTKTYANATLASQMEGDVTYPTNLTYNCEEGFSVDIRPQTPNNNFFISTCTESGKYSVQESECKRISCGSPKQINYSTFESDEFLYFQDIIVYTCDAGYTTDGQPKGPENANFSVECGSDGQFVEQPQKCLPVMCPNTPVVANATVITPCAASPCVYSEEPLYSCNTGYSTYPADDPRNRSNEKFTLQCLANGLFEAPPTCYNINNCQYPFLKSPGDMGTCYDNFVPTGKVDLDYNTVCQSGYEVTKRSITFEGSPMSDDHCTNIDDCPPADSFAYQCGGPPFGAKAGVCVDALNMYSCNCSEGFEVVLLKGPNSTNETCIPKGCGEVPTLPDATFVHPPFDKLLSYIKATKTLLTPDDMVLFEPPVKYTCDTGFSLTGTATGSTNFTMGCVMQDNVVTMTEPPTCLPVTCGAPYNISNAKPEKVILELFYSKALENRTLWHACDEGFTNDTTHAYVPSAGFYEECYANGKKSPALSCVPVNCGASGSIAFANVTSTDPLHFGDEVEYVCLTGYSTDGSIEPEKAKGLITCDPDGKLAGITPCQPIKCGYLPPNLTEFHVAAMPEHDNKSFVYPEVAEYKTFEGYTLGGAPDGETTFEVKCLATGPSSLTEQLNQILPTVKPVRCGAAPHVQNSQYDTSEKVFMNEVVYSCDQGHSTDAKAASSTNSRFTITCQANGSFTPVSECKPVVCEVHPKPFNATKLSKEAIFVFEDEMRFSCQPGYSLNGLMNGTTAFTVSCLYDGVFAQPAECLNINNCLYSNCTDYGTCEDNAVPTGNHVNDHVCVCEPGFKEVVTKNYRTCVNINDCPVGACSPGTCQDLILGYKCLCPTGYYNATNTEKKWPQDCFRQSCGSPPVEKHADVSDAEVLFEGTATYTCKTGYTLTGEAGDEASFTIGCMAGTVFTSVAHFSMHNNSCQPVLCGHPPLSENLDDEGVSRKDDVHFPEVVTYTCETGYTVDGTCSGDGNYSRTCAASGEFEYVGGVEKKCLPVLVGKPSLPNAIYKDTVMYYPETRGVTCKEGYSLEPKFPARKNFTLKTKPDCTWQKHDNCQKVSCGTPAIFWFAKVDVSTDMVYQQKATYTAAVGYSFNGKADGPKTCEVTCTATGTFSKCPSAKPVQCRTPSSIPSYAHIMMPKVTPLTYQMNITFICHPGYTTDAQPVRGPDNGAFKMTCQADGTFSKPKQCVPVECGVPPKIPHSKFIKSTPKSRFPRKTKGKYPKYGKHNLNKVNRLKFLQSAHNVAPPVCADTPGFVDAGGHACSQWRGFNCRTDPASGWFSKAQKQALLSNCRASCNTCDMATTTEEGVDYETIMGWPENYHLLGPVTAPCVEKDFKASLSPGEGYFSAPTYPGGWCRGPISIENIDKIKAQLTSGQWKQHWSARTYLPKEPEEVAVIEAVDAVIKATEKLMYECNPGWSLDGLLTGKQAFFIQCNADGKFTQPITSCKNMDDCEGNRCSPNGQCKDNKVPTGNHSVDYKCMCDYGHYIKWVKPTKGPVYQTCSNPDDCPPDACSTAGYCKDLLNDYSCICPLGYYEGQNGKVKDCLPKSCGVPGARPFATPATTGEHFYPQEVWYNCSKGYSLDGTVDGDYTFTATCNVSADNNVAFVYDGNCQPIKCADPAPALNAQKDMDSLEFPQKVSYTCLHGFTYDATCTGPTKFSMTCNEAGNIVDEDNSAAVPDCLPVSAGSCNATALPFAIFDGVEMFYGDSQNVTCMAGYSTNEANKDLNVFTVTATPDCSLTIPSTCVPLKCGAAPIVAHTTVSNAANDIVFPTEVSYTCVTGYTLDGAANGSKTFSTSCNVDGVFDSVSEYVPQRVSCGKAKKVDNAKPPTELTQRFTDVVKYTCKEGYSTDGEPVPATKANEGFEVTCLASGEFSPTKKCLPVKCAEIPSPPKSTKITPGASYVYKNVVQFMCLPGWSINGKLGGQQNFTSKCQADGKFSATESCFNMDDCIKVPNENGVCVDHKEPIGVHIEDYHMNCDSGFEEILSKKNNVRVCSNIENCTKTACLPGSCVDKVNDFECVCPLGWVGTGGHDCKRKSCGVPAAVPNAKTAAPEMFFQDTFEYACKPGYTKSGVATKGLSKFTVTCEADGKVSGMQECKPVSCTLMLIENAVLSTAQVLPGVMPGPDVMPLPVAFVKKQEMPMMLMATNKSQAMPWTTLYSTGDFGEEKKSKAEFNELFHKANAGIARRECSGGCRSEFKDVYFRRKRAASEYDAWEGLMVTWMGNVGFHKDFDIYSSLEDALADKNAWKYCNGADRNIGFPRDCGPEGYIPWNWNSFTHLGTRKNYKWSVQIPADPQVDPIPGDTTKTTFPNTVEYICQGGHSTKGTCDKDSQDKFTMKCTEDGSMQFVDEAHSKCLANSAGVLAKNDLPFSSFVPGGEIKYDDIVSVSCWPGYSTVATDKSQNKFEVKSTPNCGFEKYPECGPIVCDALPVVANAVRKKDSIKFGEVAWYTCNTGYTLDAQPWIKGKRTTGFRMSCDVNGAFAPPPSCKPVECGVPENATNAVASSSKMLTFVENTVTYTCIPGFSLDGKAGGRAEFTVTCQANGDQVGFMQCKPVECPMPDIRENSVALAKVTTAIVFMDKVKFMCNRGFSIDGKVPDSLNKTEYFETCLSTGLITQDNSCADINFCVTGPGHCGGGPNSTCVDGLLDYTCNCSAGYEAKKAADGTGVVRLMCVEVDECVDPNFKGTQLCAPHGTCVDKFNSYICDCDEGYKAVDMRGLPHGRQRCEPVECGALPSVPYAARPAIKKLVYPQNVTYTCDDGYSTDAEATGPTSFTVACQSNKKLTPVLACKPVKCPPKLPAVKNAKTSFAGQLAYTVGVANYTCDEGYTTTGQAEGSKTVSIQCDANGEFEFTTVQTCKKVTCGLAPDVEFSEYDDGEKFFGSTTTYKCDPGYSVDGDAKGPIEFTITCASTGNFTDVGACNPVSCGLPDSYANAKLDSVEKVFKEKIEVSCDTGYSVTGVYGDDTKFLIKCGADGKYAKVGKYSECLAISCGTPKPRAFSKPTSTAVVRYNESAEWKCDAIASVDGSPLGDKSFTLSCEANGMFSQASPIDCMDIDYCHPGPCGTHGTCFDCSTVGCGTAPPKNAKFKKVYTNPYSNSALTWKTPKIPPPTGMGNAYSPPGVSSKTPGFSSKTSKSGKSGYGFLEVSGPMWKHNGDYGCLCQKGYETKLNKEGKLTCSEDDCTNSKCGDGGSCVDLSTLGGKENAYKCNCRRGYVENTTTDGFPTCTPVICKGPFKVKNAAIVQHTKRLTGAARAGLDTAVISWDALTFQCKKGYSTDGSVSPSAMRFFTQCSQTGQLTHLRKCQKIKCDALQVMPVAFAVGVKMKDASELKPVGTSYSYGDTLTFECEYGFEVSKGVADFSIQCMANSKFSKAPSCKPISCGKPQIKIKKQNVSPSITTAVTFGTHVNMACHHGHRTVFNAKKYVVHCKADGDFTTSYHCRKVKCANGLVYGQSLKKKCPAGYKTDAGKKYVVETCLADKTISKSGVCKLSAFKVSGIVTDAVSEQKFLPGAQLTFTKQAVSKSSCMALGWFPLGNNDFCASDQCQLFKKTHQEAKDYCTQLDARLCTAKELPSLDFGYCQDHSEVWTSSPCPGGYYTYKSPLAWQPPEVQEPALHCVEAADATVGHAGRCCADTTADTGGPVQPITTATGSAGKYSINLVPGTYYVEGSFPKYINTLVGLTVDKPIKNGPADIEMSPAMKDDQIRIIMDWADISSDLDSWTTFGPHTYCEMDPAVGQGCMGPCDLGWFLDPRMQQCTSMMGEPITATLDRDQTEGYGPETTTISNIGKCAYDWTEQCMIVFSVWNYTPDSEKLKKSEALITILRGSEQVDKFYISELMTSLPDGQLYLPVVTINSKTGEIFRGYAADKVWANWHEFLLANYR